MLIMKDGKIRPALVKVSSSPSYTVGELTGLAKEFLQQSPSTDKLAPELILSSYLVWLSKKKENPDEYPR